MRRRKDLFLGVVDLFAFDIVCLNYGLTITIRLTHPLAAFLSYANFTKDKLPDTPLGLRVFDFLMSASPNKALAARSSLSTHHLAVSAIFTTQSPKPSPDPLARQGPL